MFTSDLVNLYNRNIFKTSLYIYIFQDEKCRLRRNLSLSMEVYQIWEEIDFSEIWWSLKNLFKLTVLVYNKTTLDLLGNLVTVFFSLFFFLRKQYCIGGEGVIFKQILDFSHFNVADCLVKWVGTTRRMEWQGAWFLFLLLTLPSTL